MIRTEHLDMLIGQAVDKVVNSHHSPTVDPALFRLASIPYAMTALADEWDRQAAANKDVSLAAAHRSCATAIRQAIAVALLDG